MDMSGSPPPGEGEVEEEEEEEDEEGDEKRLRYHQFQCGCGLPVHPADLILHSLSCLHLQPFVGPVHRITDPQVFLSSGLAVPRSLSLRTRKNHCLLANQVSIYYRKMSELLEYREDEGGEGGQDGECVDSLSTPPPAVMSFQVDETKPLLPDIDSKQQGSEDDETSQQNGILSPTDDNSKSGSVEEGPKDMATVLDVLFGGETPTVASMPSTGDASPSNASPSNASPSNASPSHASPSNASPCHATPSPESSYNADKEECEKDKEESGSELNSLIDEMLDTKDSAKSSLVGGQQGSEPTSATSTPQPTPTPTPPTISVRPMLDLMGNGRVKEEKIEEPFAALNDLVKNLQSPASSHQSSPHHPPMHMKGPESFQMMSSMSSVPPPTMLGVQGQQVSIQKRPAPQSFPAGITLTKQARRDSESSSSSSQGPSSPRLPEGITLVKGPSSQKSDPVASMLATRGVSVMPSAGGRLNHQDTNQAVSITKTKPPVPQILAGSNSALTITATPPKRNRPSPAPLTTVDLTDDSVPSVRRSSVGGAPQVTTMMRPRVPIPMGSRGRPPAATCDVCDKVFANAEALRVHMQTHTAGRRGAIGPPRPPLRQPVPGGAPPGSFPGSKPGVFECEVCTARYQTQQQLIQHTQRFHPDRFGGAVGHQFGFPVVNLDDSKTSAMLASLGIKYCIPMVDLQQSNGAPGHYALPIIAMDGSINPAVCNLDHMNCSNLLPLGPMKAIRRQ